MTAFVRRGSPFGVMLSVAILFGACGGASSSGSPAVASAPPAASPSGAVSWTPLDVSAFSGGSVAGVVPFGPGLVAVGSVPEGNTTRAATWTSADGLTWARGTDDPSFAGRQTRSAAVSGSRVVVTGCGTTAEGCTGVDAWTSTDGLAWTASTFDQRVPDFFGYNAVVGGGPGFVAVGYDWSAGFPQVPSDASVVTSTDGQAWTAVASTAFKAATMGGVAAKDGILVAIGTGAGAPVVWTSSDGKTWTRAAATGLSAIAENRDVASGGPGFVVVGRDGGNAASWISTDGTAWDEAAASPALAGDAMSRVLATSGGFVAIGKSSNGSGVVWTSSDGSTWTKLDLDSSFAAAQVTAVGEIGGRIVEYGMTQSGKPIAAISSQ